MNKKRAARYAIAGTATLIYGGAVAGSYNELGVEPAPNDMKKLKKVIIASVVMSGLTWLVATL